MCMASTVYLFVLPSLRLADTNTGTKLCECHFYVYQLISKFQLTYCVRLIESFAVIDEASENTDVHIPNIFEPAH